MGEEKGNKVGNARRKAGKPGRKVERGKGGRGGRERRGIWE